eukprot:TRINITY_DN8122_c0_g1_i1.p1 TRINITY_DN8122_c0_g1~~TRINITY_DN8122_c0_g1_i1.p1  ORF type:complete len:599 (+),score=130.05 TRINITY_DN8122_c0_g1_i1:49-1845(+)
MDDSSKPLDLIDQCFEAHLANGHSPKEFQPDNLIQQLVSTPPTTIPSLNVINRDNITPGSLVHFRCMVQDTFNPEIYLDVYEQTAPNGDTRLRTSRYRDSAESEDGVTIAFDTPNCHFKNRQTLYCVPIPAEQDWVRQAYAQAQGQDTLMSKDSLNTSTLKRMPEDEDDDGSHHDAAMTASDTAMTSDEHAQDGTNQVVDKRIRNNQHASAGEANTNTQALRNATDLNLPVSDASATPVLVKVYADEDLFKVYDMVDFIGIYTLDLSPPEPQSDLPWPHRPDGTLVPRLHALHWTLLTHTNPMVPHPTDDSMFAAAAEHGPQARQALLDALMSATGGDELAAELALLNILSSVWVRNDDAAIGKFSINLAHQDQGKAMHEALSAVVRQVMPKSHSIAMSIDYLNQARMNPKKNYELERLEAGVLQLSDGTHLILDETSMTQGQLQEQGVKNLLALQQVVQNQTVPFEFDHMEPRFFPCNLPTMVVSEGKSMLPVDVKLRCEPVQPCQPAEVANIGVVRAFVGCMRLARVEIPAETQDFIETDFVAMRQQDAANIQADWLHLLITMAKLRAASRGSLTLTSEDYSSAKAMEQARKARMN